MEKKDCLDILIEKSLLEFEEELELFKDLEYPNKEIVWQRIMKSIQNGANMPEASGRYSKVSGRWVRVAAVLVCILATSVLFSIVTNSKHVDAFRQGLIATIQHIGGKAGGISFDSDEPEFLPVNVEGSLEKVRQASAVDFPVPGELPDGYQFSNAVYSQVMPDAAIIHLTYKKNDKKLRIEYQYQLSGQSITSAVFTKDKDFEELKIDGFPVYYKEASTRNVMVWQHDVFLIMVAGDLTFGEFEELYRSMK